MTLEEFISTLVPDNYRNKIEMVTFGIKEAILSGAIKSGEKLSSDTLCKVFNVSRSPVREALRRLESDGLVKIVPQQYVQVAEIDPSTYRELTQLRVCLETLAFKLFYERKTDEMVAALKNIALEETTGIDSVGVFHVALHFHHQMVVYSGNRELLCIYERVMGKLINYMNLHYLPEDKLVPWHVMIIEAVEKGDYNLACKELEDDLTACHGCVMPQMLELSEK